jgi:hypothetical protein
MLCSLITAALEAERSWTLVIRIEEVDGSRWDS